MKSLASVATIPKAKMAKIIAKLVTPHTDTCPSSSVSVSEDAGVAGDFSVCSVVLCDSSWSPDGGAGGGDAVISRKRGLGTSRGSGASGRHLLILVTHSEPQGGAARCTRAGRAWAKADVPVDARQKEGGDILWWGRLDDIVCAKVCINF